MKTSFQKAQEETSHYIPISHWSHKTYTLLSTQTKRTTTAYSMSNRVEHFFLLECRHLALIRQRIINVDNMKSLFEKVDMNDRNFFP